MAITEYVCGACRHDFPWFGSDGAEARCPRYGGSELKANPWLLLTPDTEGLVDQDHFEALRAV